MDLINKISEAIWELEAMNCRRENLIIAYSPLIERFLVEEIHEKRLFFNATRFDKIEGIKTYNLHPYNEILVYDAKNASYHPQLLKKIEITMVNKRLDKIQENT